MKNEYHFFWKSCLSNWTPSKFSVDLFDGKVFNCGEQYMMYVKALIFNDTHTASLIMSSSNPKEIKALGRKVQNFDNYVWDKCKYRVMKTGLLARFKQDKRARTELLSHKGKIFVEASPYDKIWGIGYEAKDALSNIDNWGENLLGKILTEISEEL